MSIKEYSKSGKCEIHTNHDLNFTGDDSFNTWYECSICRKENWNDFYKFLQDTSDRLKLQPIWKGGEGLGVCCPTCKGKGLILPQETKKIINRTIYYKLNNKTYVHVTAGSKLTKNEMKKALEIEEKYLELNIQYRKNIDKIIKAKYENKS